MAVIINESFEETIDGGDGYDDTWTAYTSTGSTLDPDNAEVARPTGGGNQVLKIVIADTGNVAGIKHDAGAAGKAIVYGRFYWRVTGIAAWTVGQIILQCLDLSSNQYFVLRFTGSANQIQARYYDNGTTVNVTLATSFAINTWYRIEWRYDLTNAMFELKVDGVVEISEVLNGTLYGNHRYMQLHDASDRAAAFTQYLDLIKANDGDGWIGAEATGGLSIPGNPFRKPFVRPFGGVL